MKQAVWAYGIDKAPGFDGYNFKFIREMWEVLEEEIYEFVVDFFVSGSSVRHLNITWVTLIPKIEKTTSIPPTSQLASWAPFIKSSLK